MLRKLTLQHRSHPLRSPFRISRGVRYAAEVVTAELTQDGHTGRGEAVPYPRYGESVDSVLAQMETQRTALCAGMGRDELQARLPAGAARNALDCALWDLESKRSGVPVWARLARAPHTPVVTALTISIDTPQAMHDTAARIADARLVKIKVDAENPAARIEAVRSAVPAARLIVDPNESWTPDILHAVMPVLERARVNLIEQPIPAAVSDELLNFASPIPICADEACHTTADLPQLKSRYQAINIKLDKTGGLTEAWRLLRDAREQGFLIMVGCMVGSSLGIAPALEIAREAEFADLDGPLWLADDYADGVKLESGLLSPPQAGFWG